MMNHYEQMSNLPLGTPSFLHGSTYKKIKRYYQNHLSEIKISTIFASRSQITFCVTFPKLTSHLFIPA